MIYFDIDGLLAKFCLGSHRLHGWPYKVPTTWNYHHEHGISDADFYANMGASFWANLEPWEDGFELLRLVEHRVGPGRILFLTSPCQTPGCEEGKRAWVRKFLPTYDPWKDVMIGGAKHKLAHRGALLIDDSDANCKAFAAAGGKVFLAPRPWNDHRAFAAESDGRFNPSVAMKVVETLL